MTKGWINKLGMIVIGASLVLSVGCTQQNKEVPTQEQTQKEEPKAQKQAEKEQKAQEKTKKYKENKEVTFKEHIEKTVKKTIGKSDIESVEINKNHDLVDPNNKVVLLNLKNANDKVLTWNDTTNILKKLSREKEIQKVIFVWHAELTDTYGNKSSDPVMKIRITRDDLEKITFDHFDHNNIPKVVTEYWESPSYNKI
ncbi:TPA: hypothetical protein ACGN8S_000336 [Bacillus cereus]|uniref:hypothetical protein n=1 Tax=Bacillus sp. PM5 TaxID=3414495 RepID=UPI00377268E4